MVLDDHALEAVVLGPGGILTREAPKSRTLIDMSTVSPVSGNPSVVEAGNLSIAVSGDEAAFERQEPLLRDIGPHLFSLGRGEEARVMKLAWIWRWPSPPATTRVCRCR